MYKVSAVYTPPASAEARFDHDYYFRTHVPMMNRDFPGKVPFVKVDLEIAVETLVRTAVSGESANSAKPSSPEPVSPLIANIYFDDREAAYGFAEFVISDAAAALHADVPKFTNCDIHWTVGEINEPA